LFHFPSRTHQEAAGWLPGYSFWWEGEGRSCDEARRFDSGTDSWGKGCHRRRPHFPRFTRWGKYQLASSTTR